MITIEYIAGFFDGEGCITHIGKYRYVVSITQTNLKVLQQIQEKLGFGRIHPITKRKSHWKDAWIYRVTSQKETLHFLELMRPFCVVKVKQIIIVINMLKERIAQVDNHKKARGKLAKQILKMRKEGLSYRAIGKKIGKDHSYGWKIINGKIAVMVV